MKQENESRLLPITEYQGIQYLVDIENRQFREVPNGQVRISFRSEQGQAMVKEMLGSEWRSYGLVKEDTNPADEIGHCPRCGREMPVAEG